MKGVLLSLAPDADVVDITHDIAPQDVDARAARARARLAALSAGHGAPRRRRSGVGSARAGARRRERRIGFSSGRTTAFCRRRCSLPAHASSACRCRRPRRRRFTAATCSRRRPRRSRAAKRSRGSASRRRSRSFVARPKPTRRADGGVDGEVIVDRSLRQRGHESDRAARRHVEVGDRDRFRSAHVRRGRDRRAGGGRRIDRIRRDRGARRRCVAHARAAREDRRVVLRTSS